MDYRLIYTKPAEHDLEEIVRYIAQDSPAAAYKVGLELIELADSLTTFPFRGAALRSKPGVRKILHAPYILVYRVDEPRQMVRVLRFWHSHRDPDSLHTA